MNISPKERFLDICHFKRPGDLCLLSSGINVFPEQTLEKWVEQGAPEQIRNERFCADYFQFERIRWLGEIKSGLGSHEEMITRPKIDLGHGITVRARLRSPIVPAYELRIISEDELTATLINAEGQTVKRLKESLKTDWGTGSWRLMELRSSSSPSHSSPVPR